MDVGDLLTIEELADRLRTSVGTVRTWRKAETGPPGIRVGRRVLFPSAGVDDWLRAGGHRPADRTTAA